MRGHEGSRGIPSPAEFESLMPQAARLPVSHVNHWWQTASDARRFLGARLVLKPTQRNRNRKFCYGSDPESREERPATPPHGHGTRSHQIVG
jgi:hypothetical protein